MLQIVRAFHLHRSLQVRAVQRRCDRCIISITGRSPAVTTAHVPFNFLHHRVGAPGDFLRSRNVAPAVVVAVRMLHQQCTVHRSFEQHVRHRQIRFGVVTVVRATTCSIPACAWNGTCSGDHRGRWCRPWWYQHRCSRISVLQNVPVHHHRCKLRLPLHRAGNACIGRTVHLHD